MSPNQGDINAIDIDDVNNDQLSDVIIGFRDSVGIFFQNAGGTLDQVKSLYSAGHVNGVKAGDLNNDGLNDIAVSHSNTGFIRIFYQDNQTFSTDTFPSPLPNGQNCEVEIGDMNDDGLNDVVFLADQPYANIQVYIQNLSGSFNNYINYNIPGFHGLGGIAIGDLNNDELNDVAISDAQNSPDAGMILLLQDSIAHQLTMIPQIPAYDIPEPVEIADLNCDGQNEIITAHGGWNAVTVFPQDSNNTYNYYQEFAIPYASQYKLEGMSVGDINNDGKKDVALADYNNGLVLLINDSQSDCALPCPIIPVSFDVTDASQGNNDGAVQINVSGGAVPYQYSLDSVTFQSANTFQNLSAGVYTAYIIDWNGCTAKDSFTVSQNVGIDLIVPESASVYFNPNTRMMTIKFKNLIDREYEVRIFDLSGKSVKNFDKMTIENIEISLSNLDNGMYLVQLKINNGSVLTNKMLVMECLR